MSIPNICGSLPGERFRSMYAEFCCLLMFRSPKIIRISNIKYSLFFFSIFFYLLVTSCLISVYFCMIHHLRNVLFKLHVISICKLVSQCDFPLKLKEHLQINTCLSQSPLYFEFFLHSHMIKGHQVRL